MDHASTSSVPETLLVQGEDTIVRISSPEAPPSPNLPCLDLVNGPREQYLKYAIPLYQASLLGNWEAAFVILKEKPELVSFAITETYETMLHIAASAKNTNSVENFVKNLVERIKTEDLELQNKEGYTALALAAAVGNLKTSQIMLYRNFSLADIPSNNGMMPLYMAAAYAQYGTTIYLYECSKDMSTDIWTHEKQGQVLQKCVEANLFYVALEILNARQELIAEKRLLMDVLLALAQKTYELEGSKQHIIWRIINSVFAVVNVKVGPAEKESEALSFLKQVWKYVVIRPKGEIDETTTQALFLAVKSGNTRFIIELIRSYPELVLKLNDKGRTIFHEAVKCRNAEIYNLLYEIGSWKDQITRTKDKKGNNMLHLVARCSNLKRFRYVSGVALQMQRELLWYLEVAQMIPANYVRERNNDGYTPLELFPIKHAELVTKGEGRRVDEEHRISMYGGCNPHSHHGICCCFCTSWWIQPRYRYSFFQP